MTSGEDAKFRAIFDEMDQIIYISDPETYEILYINKVMNEYFPGDIIGKKCHKVFQNLDSPCSFCTNDKLFGDPPISPYEWEFYDKKIDRWFHIIDQAIEWENGRKVRFEMAIDITKHKNAEEKLRESEKKYRDLVEMLPDVVGETDLKGNINYVNSVAYSQFGYTKDDVKKGLNVLQLIAPEDKERALKNLKNLIKKGMIQPEEYALLKKNGERFYARVNSRPITKEGRIIGLRSTISDITEKKVHRQLIEEQNRKLSEINNLKTELLRRVSHELKTPLISIKGHTDLLLEVHHKRLDEKMRTILNEITHGCFRLEDLIKDLLESSKLESDKVQLKKKKEDLTFLINYCVKELEMFAKKRNHLISLTLHEKLITYFEKEKIYEVINNLLSNAIKYTPPNGRIEIKSTITSSAYTISIRDNGIGITKNEKKKLFTQFGKIERYCQGGEIESEGTGLGLYICKRIIELHGGEIWMESRGRNKGATFSFSLPIIKNSLKQGKFMI